MNREIETLINNLEGCIGMFDYILTPIENNLLLIYINELEQENKELHNKIDKVFELLSHFSGCQICEHTQELAIKVEEILKDSDVDD